MTQATTRQPQTMVIRADFAAATRDVLYGMCVIMAVAALVALRGLRRGVQEDTA